MRGRRKRQQEREAPGLFHAKGKQARPVIFTCYRYTHIFYFLCSRVLYFFSEELTHFTSVICYSLLILICVRSVMLFSFIPDFNNLNFPFFLVAPAKGFVNSVDFLQRANFQFCGAFFSIYSCSSRVGISCLRLLWLPFAFSGLYGQNLDCRLSLVLSASRAARPSPSFTLIRRALSYSWVASSQSFTFPRT